MANTFVNAGQQCSTSLTTLYTCPSSNTGGSVSSSIVYFLQAANVTARADVLTVTWVNASNSNAVTHLCFQTPIPANQSVGLLTGKLPLHPGDQIQIQCGIYQAIEIIIGSLEQN